MKKALLLALFPLFSTFLVAQDFAQNQLSLTGGFWQADWSSLPAPVVEARGAYNALPTGSLDLTYQRRLSRRFGLLAGIGYSRLSADWQGMGGGVLVNSTGAPLPEGMITTLNDLVNNAPSAIGFTIQGDFILFIHDGNNTRIARQQEYLDFSFGAAWYFVDGPLRLFLQPALCANLLLSESTSVEQTAMLTPEQDFPDYQLTLTPQLIADPVHRLNFSTHLAFGLEAPLGPRFSLRMTTGLRYLLLGIQRNSDGGPVSLGVGLGAAYHW